MGDESGCILGKASAGVRQPRIEAQRIKRKTFRRKRSGQKGTRVVKQQRAERHGAFIGEENTCALTEQFDVGTFAGKKTNRDGVFKQLHGKR